MIVQVALPIPVTKTFSYAAPDSWRDILGPFQRVIVPFHKKTVTGCVVSSSDGQEEGLKDVLEILDAFPFMDGGLVDLGRWAARHFVTPLGMVLKHVLPPTLRPERYLLLGDAPEGLRAMRGRSLSRLSGRIGWEAAFRHARRGELGLRDAFTGRPFGGPPRARAPVNTERPRLLVAPMKERIAAYREEIERAAEGGGNVLILVPDHHAVGRYVQGQLEEGSPGKFLWYGSRMGRRARMEVYFRVRQEGGLVVMGTINCVFLPVPGLVSVIIERPEEDDFRNEEGFKFDAISMALKKAEGTGARALIGSPGPPVVLYHGAATGYLKLTEKTPEDRPCPVIMPTEGDLRTGGVLPDSLTGLVEGAVREDKVVGIYTPRKDYSAQIRCVACRKPFLCHRCGGHLSYRKGGDSLFCGRCGGLFPYEESCPNCGSDLITFSGVGAEYIEEQLGERFKDVPVMKVTGETLGDLAREAAAGQRRPAIIVGTQALGKLYGTRADSLVLFGWEELLRVAGYRADEKVFQILADLLDALEPREVYVAAERRTSFDAGLFFNSERFYRTALENRRQAAFPPFVRLFLVSFAGKGKKPAEKALARVRQVMAEEGFSDALSGAVIGERGGAALWRLIVRDGTGRAPDALLRLWDIPGVRVEADPTDI